MQLASCVGQIFGEHRQSWRFQSRIRGYHSTSFGRSGSRSSTYDYVQETSEGLWTERHALGRLFSFALAAEYLANRLCRTSTRIEMVKSREMTAKMTIDVELAILTLQVCC